MAFLESQISPRITAETEFEVVHPARLKLYAAGGQLEQVFGDTPPLHRVNLGLGVRSKADFQELVDAFYVVMFTPYVGLRVKNWQDYQATATNSRVLQVTGTTYKLQRKHTFGSISYYRDIKKPVSGKVAVYDAGGVLLTSTPDYTAGTVVVTSGTPAYWVGEFDIPMTFVENNWRARLEVHINNLHLVNDPILMEEILL
jgi:hypothetical protein